MSESFIPASEFETASNAVKNILEQHVEEVEITDIFPPLNDKLIQIKCLRENFLFCL